MSNMMRALVKAKAEPGIWMERVPVPEIGPNDVLIRVRHAYAPATIWISRPSIHRSGRASK